MKQAIKQFLRALNFVWVSSKYWTIIKLILLVVQSVLPLATLYLMKLVVDQITMGVQAEETQDFSSILWLILVWGGISLLAALTTIANQYVNENQSLLVSNYMANIVHQKSSELELAYYENPKYLNTLHRAQWEAKHRPNQILQSLTSLLQNGVSLVGIGGLLIYLHWGAAIVLLLTAIPALVIKIKFSEKRYKWGRNRTQLQRESNYLSSLLTHAEYAKEVRLFRLGKYFTQNFSEIVSQLFRENKKIASSQAWISLIAKGGEVVAIFGAYIFIGYQTFEGKLTIGDLVMYFQAFQRGQVFLQTAMTNLASLYENKLFFTKPL